VWVLPRLRRVATDCGNVTVGVRQLENSLENRSRTGGVALYGRTSLHSSAADVLDWREEGGEREKMSRGEERGTSGSDVLGCASRSGSEEWKEESNRGREREREREMNISKE